MVDMVENMDVLLEVVDVDAYGRLLGLTYYKDEDGNWRNIGCEMLKRGMATVYRSDKKKPTVFDDVMEVLEKNARDEKIGVWGLGSEYEEPRAYRKRMRERR